MSILVSSRRKRGVVTYPPFLWITMCMSVLKVAARESGRGLSLVCPYSQLFNEIIIFQWIT
jgi:hypothetical protein